MPAPATSSAPSTRFVPALEGLRGVAQATIMAYHFFPITRPYALKHVLGSYFATGWIAVDLFFVLSAFLVTGILLDHRPSWHLLGSFQARRMLRIFPLYWAFLFVFLIVVPLVLVAIDFDGPYPDMPSLLEVARNQVWFWTYLSNFWQIAHGFPGNGLGIVWALAVEEQFYLAWPLLVLALPSPARLVPACLVVLVGSALVRAWLASEGHMRAAYFLPVCHGDAFALGALGAALIRSPVRATTIRVARWTALALGIVIAVRLWTSPLLVFAFVSFAHWQSLFCLLFAALVVVLATSDADRPYVRIFACAPLTFLGRYSYALFLLHFPMYRFVEAYLGPSVGDDPWALAAATTALCIGMSIATYRVIERPFLALKRHFPYERTS